MKFLPSNSAATLPVPSWFLFVTACWSAAQILLAAFPCSRGHHLAKNSGLSRLRKGVLPFHCTYTYSRYLLWYNASGGAIGNPHNWLHAVVSWIWGGHSWGHARFLAIISTCHVFPQLNLGCYALMALESNSRPTSSGCFHFTFNQDSSEPNDELINGQRYRKSRRESGV